VIPAKSQSERIPGKVWVTSESLELLQSLPKTVKPHLRPESLAQPTSTVVEVCKELLNIRKAKSFAVLLPTSPLRTVNDIHQAVKLFGKHNTKCVMSVTEYDHAPEHALSICECGKVKPAATIKLKRQELEPKYYHDGNIIICDTQAFLAVEDFYDLEILPLKMPRSVDINTKDDWQYAEYLMGER
jgi:CMP-N-acetylneuraminic acid synthetase